MEWPLISIIIPAGGDTRDLFYAIESVRVQDYPAYEILVVGYGAGDATLQLLRDYSDDTRIRHIEPKLTDLSDAVNEGVAAAQGRYLNVLSAHSRVSLGSLSLLYEALCDDPIVEIVYGRSLTMNTVDGTIRAWDYLPAAYRGGRNEFADLLASGCYIAFDAVLFPREIFAMVGGFDRNIGAPSFDLLVRWARMGCRFAHVPDAIFTSLIKDERLQLATASQPVDVDDASWIRLFEHYIPVEKASTVRGYERRLERRIRALSSIRPESRAALEEQLREMRETNRAERLDEKITVIVLTNGSERALLYTLSSILCQRHTHWEAIIVEQADTAVKPGYEDLDPLGRIRSLSLGENCVDAYAINTALKVASGHLFTFLRSGESVGEMHFGMLVSGFASDDYDCLISQSAFEPYEKLDGEILSEETISLTCPLSAIAVRREAIDQYGGFAEGLSQYCEWEFALRMRQSVTSGILEDLLITQTDRD